MAQAVECGDWVASQLLLGQAVSRDQPVSTWMRVHGSRLRVALLADRQASRRERRTCAQRRGVFAGRVLAAPGSNQGPAQSRDRRPGVDAGRFGGAPIIFNVEQFDELAYSAIEATHHDLDRVAECDRIVTDYLGRGPLLVEGAAQAWYHPSTDKIVLLERDRFENAAE